MNRHHRVSTVFVSVVAALMFCVAGSAQSEALTLQDKAAAKFKQLHARMQQLQIAKADSDPEESDILKAGNRYIQEKNLHTALADSKRLIQEGKYDEALETMGRVHKDMTSLLDLLLNRDLDLKKLMEEIATLEQFKQRVDSLIEEQQEEKDDAARAEALEKHLADLEKAIAEVEALLTEQKQIRSETDAVGMSAEAGAVKGIEERENNLKDTTEEFQEQLEKIEEQARELASDKSTKRDFEESETAGEGACSGAASAAATAMGQAANKLSQNQPESSLDDMDQAMTELERSKHALEKMQEETQRRLLELPFEQQSKAQEKTRIDTDRLAKDMDKTSQGKDGEVAKPIPGQKNVQQAVPKQKSAAGNLKEYKPGKAKQDQQDALDLLRQAQKKLDDALAQLRQELQDEVLRSLEERFGSMLAKQKELSALTKATQTLKISSLVAEGQIPTAVQTRCVEIADGELELAAEANNALRLLEEEGSTAVFPAATELIRDDLQEVARRLQAFHTARVTQMLQQDIELALAEMIDSLRKQIESNEGAAGQAEGQPPLVPMSAELKLLLNKQKRVNRRTAEYDAAIPEQMRVTEEARDEALQISRKERWVKEMTRKLGDLINKQNQGAGK